MQTRILLTAFLFLSIGVTAQQVHVKELQISSPITPIVLKTPVAAPTAAQAKDRLLWYKGKKIDDSTLITPQATLVRWSKPRDIVIVQPKKDPFIKAVNELAKTEQRKEQFYNKVAEHKNSVIMYPAIDNTLKEFDRLLKWYGKILKNIIDLPPAITTSTGYKSSWKHGGTASPQYIDLNDFFVLPADIKRAYQEVMASMKNYPPIDFPAPPEMEFGACYNFQCDSTAYKQLLKNSETWQEEFVKYEADIIRRSMSIFKTIGQSEKLQNDPEAVPIVAGLKKAIEFASARIDNKTDLLIRKYGNDFKRLPAVISIVISVERQKQLLGAGDETYAKTMARLLPLFDGFDKYLDQQIAARNYDVVLNMAFIIGIERQRQLLCASEENNMPDLIEKINAFNRFKLDVQIDYEGQWDGCGIAKANFTATNLEEGYLQLGLINCKYNFFLSEEYLKDANDFHYGNAYNIPLKVTNGSGTETQSSEDGEKCWQIKHDLKGLVINPYEPIASISFCKNDTEDSLQFYALHLSAVHENRQDIRYNYARFNHFDTRMQNDGITGNEPAEFEQMAMELGEMKEKLRYQTNPIAKPSLIQIEQHHFEAGRIKWLRRKLNEYEERSNPSVIVFDAKNGAEIIIDEKTNKSYRDEDEKADVVIRVKITHAPLPYKKNEIKKN